MKQRISVVKSGSPDHINELNFSKSHKFDFIRSENLGSVKNIKETIEHKKKEILARNQNFTVLNNYSGTETLASSAAGSRNKCL
jgi:hypothetical protein